MKYLLVLIVVVLGLWLLLRQRGGARPSAPPAAAKPPAGTAGPAAMVACAHCDLRLPQAEAQFDAQGRPFCSDAHRLAGPR
jgi:uncharacterized protein